MQVSRREAAHALMILRRTQRHRWARRRRRLRPRGPFSSTTIKLARAHRPRPDVATIEWLRRHLLDDRSWVSIERVQEARARLQAGEEPPADVVAEMIVRRGICDRLS